MIFWYKTVIFISGSILCHEISIGRTHFALPWSFIGPSLRRLADGKWSHWSAVVITQHGCGAHSFRIPIPLQLPRWAIRIDCKKLSKMYPRPSSLSFPPGVPNSKSMTKQKCVNLTLGKQREGFTAIQKRTQWNSQRFLVPSFLNDKRRPNRIDGNN